MHLRLTLHWKTEAALTRTLAQAEALGDVRQAHRIETVLHIAGGATPAEAAEAVGVCEQTARNAYYTFLRQGLSGLMGVTPAGRPAKLTKTQKKELVDLVKAGPEAAGFDCGCWHTGLIQALIYKRFKVAYSVHYVAELLHNLGLSYQRARFASDHLADVTPQQEVWMTRTWPAILKLAKQKKALVLFADEVSFAQWGSVSYTWAPRGEQPVVKTSGKRRAYKVFGLIDYFSGRFFYHGQTAKFNATTYQAFLKKVLRQTQAQPLILIHDGARYHSSADMQAFFATHADRLTVKALPPYSPEFNPIEHLWRNIKRQATHLRYFPTFEALIATVQRKLRDFVRHPDRILALMGKYRKLPESTTA